MKRVFIVVCALGCGRIHFDPIDDACFRTLPSDPPYAGLLDDAHLICTPEQLDAIGRHPEHWGDAFVLGADLDLAELPGDVTLIGEALRHFSGSLDGRGHVVANLRIERPSEDAVALFRFTNGAQVSNLELHDVSIAGFDNVGALVGVGLGTLALADVKLSGELSGSDNVGGLVGGNECLSADCEGMTLRNLRAENIVVTGTGANVGGIIGYTYAEPEGAATFSDVYASGSVTGDSSVGGIVGDVEEAIMERMTSEATISAVQNAGGLFGASTYSSTALRDSNAAGDVTCTGGVCGGAAGFHEGSTIRTRAHGRVTCGGNACGGLIGELTGPCEQCIATGGVQGVNDVGGLVGDAQLLGSDTIRDSYGTGPVEGLDRVGGLLGSLADGQLLNSYATGTVRGNTAVGGLIGSLVFTLQTPTVASSFSAATVMAMTTANTASTTIGLTSGTVTIDASTLAHTGTCTNTSGSCVVHSSLVAPTVLYDPNAAPYATWDFSSVWQSHPDRFPTLRAVTSP